MVGAVGGFADCAWLAAEGANGFKANRADARMLMAQNVAAGRDHFAVLPAVDLPADRAALPAGGAGRIAARCAWIGVAANRATTGAGDHTLFAHRRAVAVAHVEARADNPRTIPAGDEAIVAKALAADCARAGVCAVLAASRAALRTRGAAEIGGAICVAHGVGAQVAATLADTASGAFGLTLMAHGVATHRAAA